jgi:hypothetical protein
MRLLSMLGIERAGRSEWVDELETRGDIIAGQLYSLLNSLISGFMYSVLDAELYPEHITNRSWIARVD